ncbi:hypothetical protein BpHYR1_018462 [Brachionus plicatilis]|uniref:Uncharacterized protein n=1 Tax=Brachionus plicatilis TaxID=10195 RepID=A0A3M7QDZ6_BRAPC|nr:hypothetical protein BpHYR1_018462 [Brachionus plicatilis]
MLKGKLLAISFSCLTNSVVELPQDFKLLKFKIENFKLKTFDSIAKKQPHKGIHPLLRKSFNFVWNICLKIKNFMTVNDHIKRVVRPIRQVTSDKSFPINHDPTIFYLTIN